MDMVVVSDTHRYAPDRTLMALYERFMAQADVLIHLGDMVGEEVCDFFHHHPRFYPVRGNCDCGRWAADIPVTRTIHLEGFRIGAAHGWGPRSLVGQTVAQCLGPGYDIVLYGHTHQRDCRILPDGPLLLNPGSLLAPRDGLPGCARIRLEPGDTPHVIWIDTEDMQG